MRRILAAIALAVVASVTLTAPAQSAPPPIIGGDDAIVNPGVVSIWTEDPYRSRCNGSLIAPRWVLSAAHCEEVLPIDETTIRIGSLDNTEGYYPAGVARFHPHAGYDPDLLEHDIMLIELDRPVPSTVQRPAAWNRASMPVGATGPVAGWGWVCETDPSCRYSPHLQQLSVKILPDASCASLWFPGTELCFESADGSHAMACFGDSGTGIYTKGFGGTWQVRGVVSYDGDDWTGASCASAPDGSNGKGVAMDVAPYRDWIISVMAP